MSYLGQLHPSLVLHRKLSVLADDVVVVVLVVVLRSSDMTSDISKCMTSQDRFVQAMFPFHSAEIV